MSEVPLIQLLWAASPNWITDQAACGWLLLSTVGARGGNRQWGHLPPGKASLLVQAWAAQGRDLLKPHSLLSEIYFLIYVYFCIC